MRKFTEHTDTIYKLVAIRRSAPNTKKIARSKVSGQAYEIVSSNDKVYFLRQYRRNSIGDVEKFVQFSSDKKNMDIAYVSEDYIPMFKQ